jgi:hypothetical protein
MEKVTFHDLVVKLKELSQELGRTPSLREFTGRGISRRQIDKYKYSKIVEGAGLVPNKSAQQTDPVEVIIKPPKILIFDLEVSTKIVHTYNLYDANISPSQIIKDFYILSYAAKFLDEDTVYYMDCRYSVGDDLQVLEGIHHLIEQSDYVVGHNMAAFDLKTIKARFIQSGLAPLKDIGVIDTLKIARRHFKFSSNKLGELAKYLKCDVMKDEHSEFPGIKLFTEAMAGNQKAWEALEHYNKFDILVTEQVYRKLAPWEKSINFQAHYQKLKCSCNSEEFFKNGIKYTRNGAFQVWRCKSCSKSFVDKNNVIDKDIRKDFFK